ncbi:uncharacterized protein LOC131247040 [Magnolia sinica]|uniref:uncharacterized protein LOC131247040 n=1 Tax=Magnolia sinica TaxID=86752 RepID=UPI00265871BB|nr:uncharacterized protein LOC131247040 [Magnolia sinica]
MPEQQRIGTTFINEEVRHLSLGYLISDMVGYNDKLSSQNPSTSKGNSVLHTSDLFADFSLIIHLKKLLRFTVDIIGGQRKGFNFQSGDAKNNHLVTSLLLSSDFWSDYLSSMGTSAIRGLPKWLRVCNMDLMRSAALSTDGTGDDRRDHDFVLFVEPNVV